MRHQIRSGLLAGALAFAVAPTPAATDARVPRCVAPPDLTRLDLPLTRTARRLAAHRLVMIVALGSSSTAGAGASSAEATYPSRLMAELARRFPTQSVIATLYAIADATESLGHARENVRVVSLGVGEYPPPNLPATSARKWFSKWPTVKFAQRMLEINTQSMDELRRALFRGVKTVRINTKYTEPEMATDMLEADMNKLSKLWSRGRDSAREQEALLKEYLI
jgi:hypothetical protein